MYNLTIADLITFPIYLYIISLIVKKLRLKYAGDMLLTKYFIWGFRLKVLFIVVYTVLTVYIIKGDSVSLFFGEGKHFKELIIENPSNLNLLFTDGGEYTNSLAGDEYKGYLALNSNYTIVKISIILCFLSFSSFLSVNLIIGFIAFLGSWQLFLFFRNQSPPAMQKYLALACMAIPTVVFWSSGISKDSVCMASIGFLTKSLYDIIIRKRHFISNILIVLLAIYLIYSIKSYIILSYLPFYLLFLILQAINRANNQLAKLALKLVIPFTFMLTCFYIFYNSETLFEQYSSEKLLESVSKTQESFNVQANVYEGAFFTLGEFDGTIFGLLKMAPNAIITTFFRPFLWESHNLIMLLSALEGFALILFTLKILLNWRGLIIFFKELFSNPLVFYCLSFSLVFSIFVGISTFNFGSLVRYKIPCVPFFVIALMIIDHKIRRASKLAEEKEIIVTNTAIER